MDAYPKWVSLPDGGPSLIVQSEAEEAAVLEGRAILEETKSAEGTTYRVAGFSNRPSKGRKV